MARVYPWIKMQFTFKRGWQKPFEISDKGLEEAIARARREKITIENAILVQLSDEKTIARAALVYYNEKINDVEITLLYPLLICTTKVIK